MARGCNQVVQNEIELDVMKCTVPDGVLKVVHRVVNNNRGVT